MVFLIFKTKRGRYIKETYGENVTWNQITKKLEKKTVIDLFKSDNLTLEDFNKMFNAILFAETTARQPVTF